MRAERLFEESAARPTGTRPVAQPSGASPVDLPRRVAGPRGRWVWVAAGVAAVVAVAVLLARLRAAAPSLDRAALWIDTVKRGPFVREAHGPGSLQPERIRWITAETAGRVERLPLRPGARVQKGALLMVLSNPDVQLNQLESERQLAQAEGELLRLRNQLGGDRLSRAEDVSQLDADEKDASRRAAALVPLARQGAISAVEERQQTERAASLRERARLARERLLLSQRGEREQVAAQRAQVERLRAVVRFRRQQLESLTVVAPEDGVVQELPLELGQWVTPGALLAKVARPDHLKAELRIPDTQARDLALGQSASIDTHAGIVRGTVSRISPASTQGAVLIDVTLEGELPKGARPDLSVEGSVELEKLGDALFIPRPSGAQPDGTVELFRLLPGTSEAVRVRVGLGKSSATAIQVVSGLSEGDRVVLSEVPSAAEKADRVRLQP